MSSTCLLMNLKSINVFINENVCVKGSPCVLCSGESVKSTSVWTEWAAFCRILGISGFSSVPYRLQTTFGSLWWWRCCQAPPNLQFLCYFTTIIHLLFYILLYIFLVSSSSLSSLSIYFSSLLQVKWSTAAKSLRPDPEVKRERNSMASLAMRIRTKICSS